MLNCRQTSELISARYDRTLTLRERLDMRMHLIMCRYCSAVARQIALIQKLARMQPAADASGTGKAGLSGAARQRIATALDKTASPSGSGPAKD